MARKWIALIGLMAVTLNGCFVDDVKTAVNNLENELENAANALTEVVGGPEFAVLTQPPSPTLGELLLVDQESGIIADGLADIGDVPNRLRIAGGKAYVASSLSNTLRVFTLGSLAADKTIDLPAGANPMDVAVDGDTAWVTGLLTNALYTVDLAGGSVDSQTTPTGIQPTGVALNGDDVVVANTNVSCDANFVCTYDTGSLTIAATTDSSVVTTVTLDDGCVNAQWVEADSSGVYVLCTGNYDDVPGVALKLDAGDYSQIGKVDVGGFPGSLSVGAGKIYVGGFASGLAVIDKLSFSLTTPFSDGVLSGEDVSRVAEGDLGTIWVAQWTQKGVKVLGPDYAVSASTDVGSQVQDIVRLP